MKKNFLAIAIPLLMTGGAANAVTLYDNDGTKFDVGGSLRLMAEYSDSRGPGDHDVKIKDQSSRISFKISHDLGNGLTGFGYLEYGNDTQAEEKNFNLKNRQGNVGMKMDGVGEFAVGRILSPFDDVALSDYSYKYGGVLDFGEGSPRQNDDNFIGRVSHSVRVQTVEFGGLSLAGSYTFQGDKTDSTRGDLKPGGDPNNDNDYNYKRTINNAYTLAAYFDTGVGLKINAGYGYARSNAVKAVGLTHDIDLKERIWGVSTEYSIGDLAFAVDYGQANTINTSNSNRVNKRADLYGIGTKYKVGKSKLYAGYFYKDGNKETNDFKEKTAVLGTDYSFTSNYKIWLEYANLRTKETQNNAKHKEDENKLALGFRVYF